MVRLRALGSTLTRSNVGLDIHEVQSSAIVLTGVFPALRDANIQGSPDVKASIYELCQCAHKQ